MPPFRVSAEAPMQDEQELRKGMTRFEEGPSGSAKDMVPHFQTHHRQLRRLLRRFRSQLALWQGWSHK